MTQGQRDSSPPPFTPWHVSLSTSLSDATPILCNIEANPGYKLRIQFGLDNIYWHPRMDEMCEGCREAYAWEVLMQTLGGEKVQFSDRYAPLREDLLKIQATLHPTH